MTPTAYLAIVTSVACSALFSCCPHEATSPSSPASPLPIRSSLATSPSPSPTQNADLEQPNESAIPDYAAIVAAPDRDEADQALDQGRQPAAFLAFARVMPGMRVGEVAAGGGYTAELLARAVGPSGAVYGQNSEFILKRFAEQPWSERLKKPVMSNVTRADRPFEEPFPEEAAPLDLIVNVLFYHDTVWFEVDREAMNRNIFEMLKPGASYVILDHAAAPGAGVSQAKSLHRIEMATVVAEVTAVGFVLEERSDVWRNPADTLDWNASPSAAGERRGTSDRFALRFRKPLKPASTDRETGSSR